MTAFAAPAAHVPSPVEPLPNQLLCALGQHRMATTGQLQALLRPTARRQTVSTPLNALRRQGLVDYTVLPRSRGMRAWHLTADGVRMVKDFPALRGRPTYPITSSTAASLKTPHTLTVLRVVADASARGDEHGSLNWTPEVSHSLGDGEKVIADALMHYTLTGPGQRTKHRAFVEAVDRTTMSGERLASQLIDYAHLWSYEPHPVGRQRSRHPVLAGPAWLRWYPVFPESCSSSPAAPGRFCTTGSATCRPWWSNIHSSRRWPARCRWGLRCWTTSRRRGRPAKSGHR